MSLEKIICYILIPFILIGLFVLLLISGPKTINYSSKKTITSTSEVSEAVETLRLKSFESEGQFEEIISLRKMTEADTLLLLEAIEYQESYVAELPYYSDSAKQRLDYLKQRYDEVLSEDIYKLSIVKEELSQELFDEDDYLNAIEAIKESIALQTKINDSYSLSSFYNINRIAQLKRRLAFLNAYPIHNEILLLEAKIETLNNEEKWSEAADLLVEAIEKQLYLNSEYRSSDLSDGSKLNLLELKKITYLSTPLYQQIDDLENKAESRGGKGDNLKAAIFSDDARRVQDKLNILYADSPYNSTDRMNDLMRKAQTSASHDLGEIINTLNFEIDRDLRQRKVSLAKSKILRISDAILRMQEEFPKSSHNDSVSNVKIKYLNFIRNNLELVQDRIYENLISVPGEPGIRMLKTEVSQALYSTIIGYNPSRFIGDLKPVESVNWEEAKMFCKRLSWVMGLKIRLPKEYEFRAAVGSLRFVKLENFVVSSVDGGKLTNIASKDPLGEGFYDLLGNVSEWLYSDGVFDNEPVKHIGGHFSDSLEAIYGMPLRVANRNERSRLIGFRFVVE